MTMMSRPILTKKITRKGVVYNLELCNPAGDSLDMDHESFGFEPPNFRKEFFDDLDMTGAPSDVSKYQGKFDAWFDRLPIDKKRNYARAIDESNRIIISMVWDLIGSQDKDELFNNNLRQFSTWFAGLDVSDVDFYMTRIIGKQRLIPSELNSDTETLSEEEMADILGKVYDSIDDDLIRATSINGLLCISCTSEVRLKKAKSHLIRHGSILRDFRKKANSNGRVIYTYIFSKP
tara:strand:+ start:812 stop:1513 length:702 start_codon:yes stop_codon:yes gene_type:complete